MSRSSTLGITPPRVPSSRDLRRASAPVSRLRCGRWNPTRRRVPPSSSCARVRASVLGRLPAIEVPTPWWQDVEPVVDAARDAFGIEVVVLRMLDSELPRPQGGRVTYLAETECARCRRPPRTRSSRGRARSTSSRCRLSWADARRAGRGPGVGRGRAPPARDRAAAARPSRCARGTCRRSGGCRWPARDLRGSRSSRRSSATRATSCGGSRPARCRSCSATTGRGSSWPTSRARTSTTRRCRCSSGWSTCSSSSRRPGSAARRSCSRCGCRTGADRR